ncbi:GNAT family N-acetyltransferase [Patescibacteria group bacterium]|nr:GNAT family N-acetyltransferase [Patescibacteria group bacterium]
MIDRNREHLSQHGENTSDKYKTLGDVEESIIHPNPDKPFRLRFGIWNDKGQFVGSINITPETDNSRKAEIGYYLGSEFTGQGYMSNAALTLSSWAFLYDGVDEIYGVVHKDNAASAKVLMKAGYTETGKEDDDHTIFTLIRPR